MTTLNICIQFNDDANVSCEVIGMCVCFQNMLQIGLEQHSIIKDKKIKRMYLKKYQIRIKLGYARADWDVRVVWNGWWRVL